MNHRRLPWGLPAPLVLAAAALLCAGQTHAREGEKRMGFPETRPEGGSFTRPFPDETLDVSPPGFCWWRAGERGQVRYCLTITDAAGAAAYQSPVLDDPVHVPERALSAGAYSWTVEALDEGGRVTATRPPGRFTIAPGAFAQPWVAPEALLARVPKEHPRILFPRASLDEVRATLGTTRREAFESLRQTAEAALKLTPPPEPDYDKIEDPAVRRMAYMETFAETRRYHDNGMVHLALMYALTGERHCGEVAKAILVSAAQWDPEGISSILAPYGDEVGLGLAKSGALAYDWLYDLLTEAERLQVEKMLVARADQMLRRLTRRDYLYRPEASHDGRLPGYLVEHAIALAENPRAQVWMDYAMRTILTVFPHWAGQDGGWAEGVPYGLAYNTIYLTPFEALRAATGFDVWQRPFYRKVRHFFLYNISPRGETMPFGDTEDAPATGRASSVRALLQFHALRYNDPQTRGWVDLLRDSKGEPAGVTVIPGIILPDTLKPEIPAALPPDAAFHGVGWAALHSDLARPERDLMLLFKSSPYGAVSHSHADQNSFVLMQGGKALAIPGGSRYPTHGSPFHVKYTQQTMAHNAILVNGKGQTNRNAAAGGRLAAFETHPHLGYVCGDAAAAYGDRLTRCFRHVLMVRPSLICVVDDLEAPEPSEFQWLLHALDRMELDEGAQQVTSRRRGAGMTAHLFTPGGFAFAQTDAWPMDPKEGFPKTTKAEPAKQWHFTAFTRERAARRRIAAVLVVSDGGDAPACDIRRLPGDVVEVAATFGADTATVRMDLGTGPILRAEYAPAQGERERIEAP